MSEREQVLEFAAEAACQLLIAARELNARGETERAAGARADAFDVLREALKGGRLDEAQADAAHTPGPWLVDMGGAMRGPKVYEYARGNNTRQIALACLHDDLDPVEREANAHLIAAAPVLLAACVAVLSSPDCTLGAHERLQIRAAIAKAEGES